ncbi:MAG: Protein-L-isoaspartate O-methyltransferase [Microgenomates group bacterium GW2011_GWC1_41_8]|uniref:Protein-L-isoaspartate O-methyltransferase n=1 Tax=Candidatus Roizmanbacteria bacterium GW2011_GWA1_41_13 TaxID=1618474 RepID=A0A0G0UX53_9BACT|nr:MAG: Protein-L-isoaspartate O-methyltransferase [Candidatus Roizmanbacteria bacterium GW2011_GWA1_41_13]KKS24193.1 MAG: Protein-L-isoaspartate O-methyltransferase [Microgenomates group bacterium GW2011_GWC1_41_8]
MSNPDSEAYYYDALPAYVLENLGSTRVRTKKTFLRQLAKMDYSPELIEAFQYIDRNLFLPPDYPEKYAYSKITPHLKRERGKLISSVSEPGVVAKMTALLDIQKGDNVLEVGTGSGYQGAIISWLVGEKGVVRTIEYDERVAQFAESNLHNLGIENVEVIVGDGSCGYEMGAPYDRIIVTASLPPVLLKDSPLFQQLKPGGVMVAPVGGFEYEGNCHMVAIGKSETQDPFLAKPVNISEHFSFVSMQGMHGWDAYKQGIMFGQAFYFMHTLGWGVSPQECLQQWR